MLHVALYFLGEAFNRSPKDNGTYINGAVMRTGLARRPRLKPRSPLLCIADVSALVAEVGIGRVAVLAGHRPKRSMGNIHLNDCSPVTTGR
jgi:hypothetical protein